MEQLQVTADTGALTTRIMALINAKRLVAARQLLSALQRLTPPSPDVAELAVRIALSEGCLERGLRELDEAIAQYPEHASLRKWRAELRLRTDDAAGSLIDAAE